jgi:hypothetical protein
MRGLFRLGHRTGRDRAAPHIQDVRRTSKAFRAAPWQDRSRAYNWIQCSATIARVMEKTLTGPQLRVTP